MTSNLSVDPSSRGDRAASFEHGAAVYAQIRPGYPAAAVDDAVPASARRVLDLAAGTGKLTVSVVAPGREVVAVDPSPAMLAELTALLPDVEAHVGTAESIPLLDASVDAVVVGQAWHWFDDEAAAAEIARVLTPGGHLAVLWNDRDQAVDWVARLGAILHQGDTLDPDSARGERAPAFGQRFSAPELVRHRWTQTIRTEDLRTLGATRSFVLTLPPDERAVLLDQIDELAADHLDLSGRDEVKLPYVTSLYRATLLPAG